MLWYGNIKLQKLRLVDTMITLTLLIPECLNTAESSRDTEIKLYQLLIDIVEMKMT